MTVAIALCAHANSELNIRRKELIKPDLHEDYQAFVFSSSTWFSFCGVCLFVRLRMTDQISWARKFFFYRNCAP